MRYLLVLIGDRNVGTTLQAAPDPRAQKDESATGIRGISWRPLVDKGFVGCEGLQAAPDPRAQKDESGRFSTRHSNRIPLDIGSLETYPWLLMASLVAKGFIGC